MASSRGFSFAQRRALMSTGMSSRGRTRRQGPFRRGSVARGLSQLENRWVMRGTAVILMFAGALLASAPSGHAFRAPYPQSAQAQMDDFDGNWVGSGRIARPIFRTRCGDGPLIEMRIQDGTAKAVFKAFVKGKSKAGLKSHVIPLSGRIDDDGRLELSGYESAAMAILLASNGSGEGTWEFRNLFCDGTLRVRRKP